ncbi:unnamed protein product, partial [Heterotrigona itama]
NGDIYSSDISFWQVCTLILDVVKNKVAKFTVQGIAVMWTCRKRRKVNGNHSRDNDVARQDQ